MKKEKEIGVFVAAGSKTPFDKDYLEQGRILGEFLGKNGYTFIQGGSCKGLMGSTYNEFIKYSKKIILHRWKIFEEDGAFIGKDHNYSSLNLRLEGFIKDTDILIVLPGANGTLHEFCTFFEYARYFKTHYKIILVNYKGYYDSLLDLIERQTEEGFYKEYQFEKTVDVVENVFEAIELLPNLKHFK